MIPVKTPVRLPRSVAGSIPARSKVSHAVSSSSRCCGSVARASRGDMPKNSGSNWAASYRNPPRVVYVVPRWSGSGSYSAVASQPRSGGNSPMASVPEATSSHSSSGEATPPG
jgi:hypothetical protein